MDKEYVNSDKAPSTKGFPLSHAVLHDFPYTMEIFGQIGLNPETGRLVAGIENETNQALDNIGSILSEVGWDFRNIIKVRKRFEEDFPARAVIGVKELPLGANVEIECTAAGEQQNQPSPIRLKG